MQYIRSISGSVSKTWNSINPATLSGAIDVIVVEQQDGSLACSPFHVRFGKIQLLRPSDKKVQFTVNDVKQDYPMKLGEGGEAFFVFETTESIPEAMQTSPLVSPEASPQPHPSAPPNGDLPEPEPLDLSITSPNRNIMSNGALGDSTPRATSPTESPARPTSGDWSAPVPTIRRSITEDDIPPSVRSAFARQFDQGRSQSEPPEDIMPTEVALNRTGSPPPVSQNEAMTRAVNLSKKLWSSNIPATVTETGDLMLDMTGYKSTEEQALRAEVIARKLLSEELEGDYDIGALIGVDENGNIWIYSSEEAKDAANRKVELSAKLKGLQPAAMRSSDAISDPGYHSDDDQDDIDAGLAPPTRQRHDSDSALGLSSTPTSPEQPPSPPSEPVKSYAKTLRLTSDQLKSLNLHPGGNSMSFTVNRAVCQAFIYLWSYTTPIVISDIDGTITKSDVMGQFMNSIGRDWTHLGVAKLYTDISANGYNIFYLTSRSVGQADTTRGYLNGVQQEGYKLPKGPVIMSPDRTMAALKREVYLRKPEVFKMACLRDIMSLFNQRETPFYAGFGNRFTDALSYRSVNIPQQRIFTINSNAEVSLDLVTLNTYRTGYVTMRELVDHYFPPVGMLIKEGGEEFTDFNYWREQPLQLDDFSASESDDSDDEDDATLRSEDEYGEGEDMEASYFSRDSIDEGLGNSSILDSIEGDDGMDEE
ncbi:LNS2-domain-containing protein, partial [Rhizodiscina lignyota]